jgi:hypothetical protein
MECLFHFYYDIRLYFNCIDQICLLRICPGGIKHLKVILLHMSKKPTCKLLENKHPKKPFFDQKPTKKHTKLTK